MHPLTFAHRRVLFNSKSVQLKKLNRTTSIKYRNIPIFKTVNYKFMTHEEIKDKIKESITEIEGLDPSEIKDDSTFKTLGIDSLDTVELVLALEEKFDIEMPDAEVEKLANSTFSELVSYIAGKVN